jgi:adhesin transport system outer membrane protein
MNRFFTRARQRKSGLCMAVALCAALLSPLAQASGMVDLLGLAFEGNPLLQSQARLVEASRAEVRGATWQYFPTPSVSVEQVNADKNDTAFNKDKQVMTLRLQQPLWTAGRLSAGVSRAEAVAAAAQAQMEETRQQLALRTIQTWGDWRAGQQKVRALRESLQTHERLYAMIQRRVQVGVSAEADEVLAQSRLEQTQAELVVAQAQLTSALARLEQLTGRRLESPQLNAFVVQPIDADEELGDLLERAWLRSPSNARLQAQIKQYEMEVQIRRAQTLPEVYARAEHQQGSFSASGLSSSNRFFIGLSASPGAGLSGLSGVDAAQARLQAAQGEIESARRNLIEQVSLEYIAALTQRQRLRSLSSGLRWILAMVDSWDRQFLAGRKTWVEVMNAARELAQAHTALAEVEVAHVVASWRLAVITEGVPAILAVSPPAASLPRP